MKIPCLAAAALFFALPVFAQQSGAPARITLKTTDGWLLAADWTAPAKGRPAVIFMHGLGSTRGEWSVACAALEKEGFGCLAIDMRAHGESNHTPVMKDSPSRLVRWEEMPLAEWASAAADVEAGAAFLKKKKIKRYALGGASVGANVCLYAVAERKVSPAALLLFSPGANFGGIDAFAAAGKIKLPLLVAASRGDIASYPAALRIAGIAGAGFIEAPQGHGVNMFAGDVNEKAGVLSAVVDWLKELPPLK